MMNSKITHFWEEFKKTQKIELESPKDSWHFCNNKKDANELAELVLAGIKTATSSLKWIYDYENDPLPQPGEYHIITNWDGDPVCIIQLTDVKLYPLNQVPKEVAFNEGEGDRSLAYWRKVHWKFFTEECREIKKEPTEEMPIVVETFRKVYP